MSSSNIAITMGEPFGIGGEITILAWLQRKKKISNKVSFFLIDDPLRIAKIAQSVFNKEIPIKTITNQSEASLCFADALPVMPLNQTVFKDRSRKQLSQAVLQSIEMATTLALKNKIDAIVTNPIAKHYLYDAGFKFPGHTEFLSHLSGKGIDASIMMLASENAGLKVVLQTVHIPLNQVARAITKDKIIQKVQQLNQALKQDFAIAAPRIAISGLNPHAGEMGKMGHEEMDIIIPAIEELQSLNINAQGPFPADSMFHLQRRKSYDAALCMYHDQALIPLKTLDFFGAVNITLNLPIVRTSPDHGSAEDIAGTGKADPSSLIAAINQAAVIAENRKRYSVL